MESAEKRDPVINNPQQRGQLVIPRNAPWSIVTTGQQVAQPVYDAMRETLLRIRREPLAARDLAYEIIEFFTILVRHETGLISPRRGLSLSLDKLCAGRAWSSLAMGIMRWADKTISNPSTNDFIDQGEVERDLESILDWYSQRSLSIDSLMTQSNATVSYDQLFKIEIFHDHYEQSNHGFLVQAGLALFGRANQSLWLKIFVVLDGEYVLPRPGWDSWIDDTEIFSISNDRNSPCFAAILPIAPETQRAILDNVRVFVPYAALDLPVDKQEVEIEASLYNEKGEQLLRASTKEVMSVSPYREQGYKMLSYQAQGLWPEDSARGFAVRNIFSTTEEIQNKKKIEHEIKLNMDIDMLGEPNSEFFIEVRCAHTDGELIASKKPESADNTIIYRVPIKLARPVYTLHDYSIKFPLNRLNLDGSEEQISIEVCLIDSHERVQCGAISVLDLPVSASTVEFQKPRKESKVIKFFKDVVGI